MSNVPWRVGDHYCIHVYEGDRPVATFHRSADARLAVDAVNALAGDEEDVYDKAARRIADAQDVTDRVLPPADDDHETSSWPCRFCGQTVTWKDPHACIRTERADPPRAPLTRSCPPGSE